MGKGRVSLVSRAAAVILRQVTRVLGGAEYPTHLPGLFNCLMRIKQFWEVLAVWHMPVLEGRKREMGNGCAMSHLSS